uniref:Uncharacterized protein n=1 Tax=Rhizophora mucronata TaxID=61149 RepID=A0A2P2Q3P1_RHIMU
MYGSIHTGLWGLTQAKSGHSPNAITSNNQISIK